MTDNAIEVANAAAARGEMDVAFNLLVREAPSPERNAGIWRFCDWLASAGFIAEAEDRLRRMLVSDHDFASDALVKLWTNYAVLDPRIKDDLCDFLSQQKTPGHARRGLRLMYFIDGASEVLFETYSTVLNGYEGTETQKDGIIADLLSISAGHGTRQQLNDALASAKGQLTLNPNRLSLHLDRYFMENGGGEICPKFTRRRAAAFTGEIDTASAEVWSRLASLETSVAIVGNSSVERGRRKGAEIDGHDIVIRFNLPKQDQAFAIDYGSKTDLIVINHSILQRLDIASLVGEHLLITGPDWDSFTVNRKAARQLIKQGNRITIIPQHIRNELTRSLLGSASSGLQVCAAVADARRGTEGVGFFGFSMTDQIGDSPTSANYFRKSRPVFRHNWKGEAAILEAIRSNQPWPDVRSARYENHWGSRQMFRPKRFRLLGDHSDYHCGSAAVMLHLRDCLAPQGVVTDDAEFDTLVVNGEGSMHHNSPAYIEKMEALKVAQDAGLETMLVNSVWQANDNRYDDVLKKLDKIYVRERASQVDLKRRHGIDATLYPDFAYYSRLDPSPKVLDFEGRMVCTDVYSTEFNTFVRWTGKKEAKFTYLDMQEFTWSELVASLKTAEILITGRQHAVYAACRAEIPFVAFPGNTHKIEGLLMAAGVDIPMCTRKADLNKLIRWARRNKASYTKLFEWLKSQPTWFPGI
ncbi:Polysaccharide pyruvyl transferase [Cognatiyoonia koreensis]|uniref:Polysaccharide pyruvyl transferase n=1 Tax=Cognatiyoonia koreensis TaxID=364200 RepID=A0A1I0PD52_9RHOB|nr:glycosyltransferase family 29 protein [Cognatiyoonia koreensis]SEW11536.1 Polysaccharide pyruvyl transferase [Cognatiyoonia koreensis]